MAVYYEVVNQHANQIPAGQIFNLQYVTRYTHGSGEQRVRVTTAARRWADSSSSTADLVAGFDQEAAAVLMARHAAFKTDYEDAFDVLRWLDRTLVRVSLASRFSGASKTVLLKRGGPNGVEPAHGAGLLCCVSREV